MLNHPIKHFDVNGRPIFQGANEFSVFVEKQAAENRATTLEAMIEFINEYDIEPEQLKPLISQSLRDKLEQDFIDAGLLRAKPTLEDLFV